MYARVFTTQTPPDKADELTRTWQSMVAPHLKQAEGFKGLEMYAVAIQI